MIIKHLVRITVRSFVLAVFRFVKVKKGVRGDPHWWVLSLKRIDSHREEDMDLALKLQEC
jgi:hypothetical protein